MYPDNEFVEKLKIARKKIDEAKKVLLVTHERPDGDAFACLCAMIDFLITDKVNYQAYVKAENLGNYSFLPHSEKIIFAKEKINFFDFDLILVFDCGSASRTNLVSEIENKKTNQYIIEFDHHPRLKGYSDLEIRNSEAVSTTEILYHFFKNNKIRISKNVANCLLAGILDDTDNFFHQITSGEVINIASEMLVKGAQFSIISRYKWQNKTIPMMKIWGVALNNLRVNKKYNFAYSILPRVEIEGFASDEDMFSGISNFLCSLTGVYGVMLIREEIDSTTGCRQIKGSLRGIHPRSDISGLAKVLGGGGHPKAAGFVIKGSLEKNKHGWRIK